MKSFKYIINLLVLSVIFFACSDDYDRSSGGDITSNNPVLNMLSQNEFLIEKAVDGEDGDFLFRSSWTAPRISYTNGLPVEVSNIQYELQAGVLGNEYEQAVTITETDKLFDDIYSGEFYRVAEELVEENFAGTVNLELRVLATYNGSSDTLISNSVTVVLLQEETVEPEELTIRFKQTAGAWEEFAVYAYGDSEVYGGWPGQVLEVGTDGWYSFTVPINRPINFILNDNGNGQQMDFLTDPVSDACYELNTSDGTWSAVECPALPITIRWKYAGTDWTTSAIYAWGGEPTGETFGAWPGTVGVPDANGWCTVSFASGQTAGNIIFNNGTGGDGAQFDVSITVTENTCFEITSDSYTVVDCE
ncbi:starch-binding protein [Geofilum sp. OHC36d9]|uniref:starch-binding protein n=1 Tax=Geofilum sp. OHC36d9 TaxID=3458413 RepID=UPI004033759D